MANTRKFEWNRAVLWFVGAAFCFWAYWGILSGKYMFAHDSFYWYGIFQHFAEGLQSGYIPVWNPFSHAGEMFFENFSQLSLIDPINIAGILVGKWFGVRSLFFLYEVIVILRLFVMVVGVQLFLEELVAELKPFRYFLFFVIFCSSFVMNCYHQNGAFLTFSYTPYVLLFVFRFSKTQNWSDILWGGYFFGISFESIVFSYVATFLILFGVVIAVSRSWDMRGLVRNSFKLSVAFFLFLGLSFPAWSLLFYRGEIFPYARDLINPGGEVGFFFLNYELLKNSQAAFGRLGDFATLGFLPMARVLFTGDWPAVLGTLSELSMYIGSIPFLLGLAGIFWGKQKFKAQFLALLFLTAALFLGPKDYNLVYWVLFHLVPSLRLLENTHEFSNYFLLCFFYFVALGILVFVRGLVSRGVSRKYLNFVMAGLFIAMLFEYSFYVESIYCGDFFTAFKKTSSVALDFKVRKKYMPEMRLKSVLPRSSGAQYARGFGPDLTYQFNFTSTIMHQPTATDFPVNFSYDYHEIYSVTSLTYPVLYTDLLKSKTSEKVKESLLGVSLPPFQFYRDYHVMSDADILDPRKASAVFDLLKKSVVLSPGDEPTMDLMPMDRGEFPKDPLIRITKAKPHYLELELDALHAGVLLFRDGYNPHWHAKVNGDEQEIFRANYNSKAVFLRTGINKVEFSFRPTLYLWAWKAYAFFSLMMLAFLCLQISRKGHDLKRIAK